MDQIPPKLADDLGAIYRTPISVPARLDDVILNRARAQLARSSRWRTLRWVGAAAAAACVVLAARFYLQPPANPEDLDGNRRVDIVDALVLAHQLQAGKGRDINHDGAVDQNDVDSIAMAVVQLTPGGVQ